MPWQYHPTATGRSLRYDAVAELRAGLQERDSSKWASWTAAAGTSATAALLATGRAEVVLGGYHYQRTDAPAGTRWRPLVTEPSGEAGWNLYESALGAGGWTRPADAGCSCRYELLNELYQVISLYRCKGRDQGVYDSVTITAQYMEEYGDTPQQACQNLDANPNWWAEGGQITPKHLNYRNLLTVGGGRYRAVRYRRHNVTATKPGGLGRTQAVVLVLDDAYRKYTPGGGSTTYVRLSRAWTATLTPAGLLGRQYTVPSGTGRGPAGSGLSDVWFRSYETGNNPSNASYTWQGSYPSASAGILELWSPPDSMPEEFVELFVRWIHDQKDSWTYPPSWTPVYG